MTSAELLGLRLKQYELHQTPSRVGLLHSRTGTPVFVLCVEGWPKAQEFCMRSLGELDEVIASVATEPARAALRLVRPFFLAGGLECLLSVTPHSVGSVVTLESLIGARNNYLDRTGLERVTSVLDRADVVTLPQAGDAVGLEEFPTLAQHLQSVVGNTAAVGILDFPKSASTEAVCKVARSTDAPAVAAVYPSAIADDVVASASVVWAGLISQCDAGQRLAETFVNTPVSTRITPMRTLSAVEAERLIEGGVNPLHLFATSPKRDARFLGGLTLCQDRDSVYSGLLAQRTIRAVQDAILSTCEAFVLEPAQSSTQERMKATLTHMLESNQDLFERRGSKLFDLDVVLDESKSVSGFQVSCRFFLPQAVREIQLELNV